MKWKNYRRTTIKINQRSTEELQQIESKNNRKIEFSSQKAMKNSWITIAEITRKTTEKIKENEKTSIELNGKIRRIAKKLNGKSTWNRFVSPELNEKTTK